MENINKSLLNLTSNIDKESFLFDLLEIYDFPKATITLLKKGDRNLSKNEGEYFLKHKFLFKEAKDKDPHLVIDELGTNESILKQKPRFLIVTDYKTLLAQDLKTYDSLDIPIKELADNHEFFFPWMGRERSKLVNEAVADIKAATKMGELYDLIVENNPTFATDEDKKHAFNMFFAQLLFCLFAEDTGLFEDNIFTNTIASYSDEDGSDLKTVLSNIFRSLDSKDKSNFPAYCKDLPYVGGDLFKGNIDLPVFSRKARANIIEAGKLDWYEINPDIFGSMIQVISSPEDRASLGEHYTSVPNIMKVINPLFMNSLNEQFDNCESEKDYEKLLRRIYSLKIFDPASGSGNFLIVTYKQLCQLEFKIFSSLQEINSSKWILASIGIRASQFYAITIQDFDAQIAKLSINITEHQMNQELSDIFGEVNPTLPFSNKLNIRVTNSLHEDWAQFLNIGDEEIYIIGNPPYIGSKKQTNDQKNDMELVFNSYEKYGNIDYVGCWFKVASECINKNIKAAFVSTNSIVQGTMASDLWKNILAKDIEIDFAVRDFPWNNNASKKAAVKCVIVSIRKTSKDLKFIFDNNNIILSQNINEYLMDAPSIFIDRRNKPLSIFPEMIQGNIPLDNGYLRFTQKERDFILQKYPDAKKLFKKALGSDELLNNIERWCLWFTDDYLQYAKQIPEIKDRIDEVYKFRLSGAQNAKACADRPHQFCMTNTFEGNSVVIPIVSSITREYLPIGISDSNTIVMNSALVIQNYEKYILGIISSRIHMLWVKSFAGKLHTNLRYSVGICWYSFPFPEISSEKKSNIETLFFEVLDMREKYSDKTLAQIYNKDMPQDLKQAHMRLDLEVESCYSNNEFKSDTKRIEALMKMYSQLLKKKNNNA